MFYSKTALWPENAALEASCDMRRLYKIRAKKIVTG